MEGTKNGHLASSKWVAGDQGRGGAGDSGHGNKWIHLRHNQGAKPTGQGDGFNGGGAGAGTRRGHSWIPDFSFIKLDGRGAS